MNPKGFVSPADRREHSHDVLLRGLVTRLRPPRLSGDSDSTIQWLVARGVLMQRAGKGCARDSPGEGAESLAQ